MSTIYVEGEAYRRKTLLGENSRAHFRYGRFAISLIQSSELLVGLKTYLEVTSMYLVSDLMGAGEITWRENAEREEQRAKAQL